jgi:hypothetical protein
MADGDRATVDIDLVDIEPEIGNASQRLAGERLVQLDNIELSNIKACAAKRLARSLNRTDAHDLGLTPETATDLIRARMKPLASA